MQIVVNTRLLLKNRLDGIGWFSYQVLKRITQKNPDVHFVFLFDRPFDQEFVFADNVTPLIVAPQARHPFLYYAWLQVGVKGILNRMRPDLFLSPDGFLSLGAICRQLPVIHDINFLHYPNDSKWLTARYYNYFFPKFAAEATRIATVSQFSKKDITDNYSIDPSKIDVVYNGINSFFRALSDSEKLQARQRFAQGKNYFVCVGSLHPRKNIARLIRAFAAFKQQSKSDVKLVLAGAAYWGAGQINAAVNESGVNEDIVFTGRLADEDLTLALGGALALTFVPYYEGFGIPLIEAMEAQVPIISANVTSLPEVAGNAALYVNPGDETEIKNAMLTLYNNEALQRDLVNKGLVQKQNFSWDKTSELMWNSIQKAMQ